MSDFLTRRRLIFAFAIILFVAISVLFIAQLHSQILRPYDQSLSYNISKETNTCHLTEPVDVITLCQKCTSYERRSKAAGCYPSGYKEYVLCSKSNIKTSRACPVPINIQRQHFWLFQGVVCLVSLIAMGYVHLRKKTLDKQMVDKIKRQIEDSEQ